MKARFTSAEPVDSATCFHIPQLRPLSPTQASVPQATFPISLKYHSPTPATFPNSVAPLPESGALCPSA
eukprot:415395-Rhodomonas_salina.1